MSTSDLQVADAGPKGKARTPPPAAARLDRPIFIVGTGRCGSTVFHQIFAHHPQIAFLSGLCALYPDRPAYNRWAMRLMDVPVLRSWARRKFRPAEHWNFWERYARGFSEPCRDLRADDVRPVEARRVTRILAGMTTSRRPRLLTKLTGWPRIGYLAEIFPDALFIHMIRDGRSVVNSLLEVDFWEGWRGPDNWRWGELSASHRREWEQQDRSFVALAAIEWKTLMDAFESAKERLPASQYLEVRYEDFAVDPAGIFDRVFRFAGLDGNPPGFRAVIDRFQIESTNYKWKNQLTEHQQAILETCLEDHLRRYGYI